MRIGLVSYWFNRGQATVARQLRDLLEGLGHETVVLARPTKRSFRRSDYVADGDVWRQPGVTRASAFLIPVPEYLLWAAEHELGAVFCDQNYQFEAIAELRATGVRTIGRFVWEDFRAAHVPGARAAFDDIYALTRCEHARYRTFGIDPTFVRWGCHPETIPERVHRGTDTVTFFFPGGYLSRRKPLAEVVEAFASLDDPRLRLIVKTQGEQHGAAPAAVVVGDRGRVQVIDADLDTAEYRELLWSADVCVAPSRWEGLGLHLYEATAAGLPIITNDRPPMDEVVEHEANGLLIRSLPVDPAPSGIPAFDPEPASLAEAMSRMADEAARRRLAEGARAARDGRLSWQHTIADVRALLGVEGGP